MSNKMESILSEEQMKLIRAAGAIGLIILIDGDRSTPTGKSTLCGQLREEGIQAYEAWEFEEGVQTPDKSQNTVCAYVWLGKSLKHDSQNPRKTENYQKVRQPYQRRYSLSASGSGRDGSLEDK